MKTQLKSSLSNTRTSLTLSFLCILFGVLCAILGEIVLPLSFAFLAALYLFDSSSGRKFSFITSGLIVAINVFGFCIGVTPSVFSLASIMMALIISSSFKAAGSKADAAYLMTVICAVFSLIGYIIFAMMQQNEYTVEAALAFYEKIADVLRKVFVTTMVEAYNTGGINVTAEALTEIFDSVLSMIISYLLIAGFAIVGIGMKIFGAIVARYSEDKTEIKLWRFVPTKLYAYFYVALAFASIFVTAANSVFAISVLNLYNVFMFIFAYVGFNIVIDMLKKKFKPAVSVISLLLGCLLLASFAIQLLAVLGAIFTVRKTNDETVTPQ